MNSLSVLFTSTSGGDTTTIVFPHAGGSPRFFHPWKTAWSEGSVWGVTYPCRDARFSDPMPATVQQLAVDTATDIIAALPQIVPQGSSLAATVSETSTRQYRRLRLFGHSLGALVAYETARWLTQHRSLWDSRHEVTIQLVASGHNAPHIGLPPDYEILHTKPDAELIAELAKVDAHNAEVFAIPELAAVLLPALREDYRLAETYRCSTQQTMIDEVMAVCGVDDEDCFPVGVNAWQTYAVQWLGSFWEPGGHFYLGDDNTVVPILLQKVITDSIEN